MNELIGGAEASQLLGGIHPGIVRQWIYNHGFNVMPCGRRTFYWRAHIEQVKTERIAWGLLPASRAVSQVPAPRAPVGVVGTFERSPDAAAVAASIERRRHFPVIDDAKLAKQRAINAANRDRVDDRVDDRTLLALTHRAGGKKMTKPYRDAIADANRFETEKRSGR